MSCDVCFFLLKVFIPTTGWKVSEYGVFSGPYFPAFGLNTEIYGVNLRIQSECGKSTGQKNSISRLDNPETKIIMLFWDNNILILVLTHYNSVSMQSLNFARFCRFLRFSIDRVFLCLPVALRIHFELILVQLFQ